MDSLVVLADILWVKNRILHYKFLHSLLIVDATPSIRSVSPLYGPEAGGTRITLRGNRLTIGYNMSVDVVLSVRDEDAMCQTESL